MSGGDLDGDTYFVCWDQELISQLSVDQMYDPGNYDKPSTISEKPPQEGLADYFVFYLERDILGKMVELEIEHRHESSGDDSSAHSRHRNVKIGLAVPKIET